MPETFSPLVWRNDQTPAINESNLNRLEVGVEALDDRAASLELGICPVAAVSFASSITLNATQGGLFRCVASADLTLDQIVGGTDGQTIVFEVQASGGPRTLHFTGSTDTVDIAAGQWWVGVFRYIPSSGWVRDETAAGGGSTNDLNILAPQNLPYAATITPDASTGALFRVTAPGDFTLADPINGTDGQAVVVEVLASGGSRTVSFAAGYSSITIPAGTRWASTLRYNATTNSWLLATASNTASAVASVNGFTGAVALTADNVPDGSVKVLMTPAERTKLAGVASGATAYTDELVDDRVAALIVAGANITKTYDDTTGALTIASSGGSGYSAVQDEGTARTARSTINFVGAGVTVTDDGANTRTLVTIPGGAAAISWVNAADYGAVGNAKTFIVTSSATSGQGVVVSQLATPSGVGTTTSTSTGQLAAGTYGYRVSAFNRYGETTASATVTRVTTGSTSTVTLSWTAVTGADGYQVYGRTSGSETRLTTVAAPTTSYVDRGGISPSGTPLPSANTTGPFSSDLVGKPIYIGGGGAAGAQYAGTVATYTSATQITVTPNLSTTVAVGATGTAGTNNSTAIASAVAALTAGSALYFPAGRYLSSSTVVNINGKSDITITGDHATLIGGDETAPVVLALNSSQVSVSGLRIQHASTTARTGGGFGLQLKYCQDVALRDCHIFQTTAAGVYLDGVTRATVYDCTVRNNLADGIHTTNASTDVNVVGNRLYNVGDDAIAFVGYRNDGAPVQRFTATGNTIYQSSARGVGIIGASHGAIVGNTIRATRAAGIIVAQETSFTSWGCSDILIEGNTIVDANTYNSPTADHGAIHVNGADSAFPISGVSVKGNHIRTPRRCGLIASGYVSDLVVAQNHYVGPSTDNVDCFVLAGTTLSGVRMVSNRIAYANESGIIHFDAVNKAVIENNEIYYPRQSNGGGNGINIASGSARVQNNHVIQDPGKTALSMAVAATPSAAAVSGSTGAGTSPPSPAVGTGATDQAGALTFGTGSGTVGTGAYVTVTFHCPFSLAPRVLITPTNAATAVKSPYVLSVGTTSFQIGLGVAGAVSQGNTVYGISWQTLPS